MTAAGDTGWGGGRGTDGDEGLDWLVTDLVERVPGLAHAVLVSADGLPIARSAGVPPDRADQLAAITSGLSSLTGGAARVFEGGPVDQTVVEMRHGTFLVTAIGDGSSLAVLAAPGCDMGLVTYEMTLLADRVGDRVAPGARVPDAPGTGARESR